MDITELVNLGFNKNEAEVYIALSKFGNANARDIIRETKFHKKIVYDNLQKLIDKGFVSFIEKDSKRFFSLVPSAFSSYAEEQEDIARKNAKLALRIKNEIEKINKLAIERPNASIYFGIKAVKSFYAEVLNKGDYYVLGAPKESVDIMGELFWESHHLKRKKYRQRVCLLLNPSLKSWGKNQKKDIEIKYFEKGFEPKTEFHIQDNMVAIIIWSSDPIIFRINSKDVAKSYLDFFNKLWKSVKE